MEMDLVVANGGDTGPDLSEVSCGTDKVDGDVVAGHQARQVEELIQMTVCYEGDHHYHHSGRVVDVHFDLDLDLDS